MNQRDFSKLSIIILAAGKGKRMKSSLAKVLHKVCGREMILHVLDTASLLENANIFVVVGHQADRVKEVVVSDYPDTTFVLQEEQRGTGHAVMCAMPALPSDTKRVIILCGDVPLIRPETLFRLVSEHETRGLTVTIVGIQVDDPTGYGRIVQDEKGMVKAIVEELDADPVQRGIRTVNSGVYCVDRDFLALSLKELDCSNAQGEYYLTDIVSVAARRGERIGMILAGDPFEMKGVNTTGELKQVEDVMSRSQKT